MADRAILVQQFSFSAHGDEPIRLLLLLFQWHQHMHTFAATTDAKPIHKHTHSERTDTQHSIGTYINV